MLLTLLITHSHGIVRECFKGDEASQWKRPKFNPSPPLNRSSQKLAGVITSWTAPGMQNFVAIGSGVSAYTLERIFTQHTSKDFVPGKEVPFGGPRTIIVDIFTLKFPKKPPFRGPILTGQFFAAENRFNMGML